MAFLFVPPTDFLTENAEAPALLAESAKAYTDALIAQLGIRGPAKRTEDKGAFRGLRVFEFTAARDAVLYTVFAVAPEKKQTEEFLRLGALVWKKDCLLAGATWEKGAKPLLGLPKELEVGPSSGSSARGPAEGLAAAVKRTPQETNTVRWETQAQGIWAKRLQPILEIVGGERLAAKGVPVNASVSRLACKWIPEEEAPAKSAPVAETAGATAAATAAAPAAGPSTAQTPNSYPRRAHRMVYATLREGIPPSGSARSSEATWPRAAYETVWTGGVFGERRESIGASAKDPLPFAPVAIADAVAAKIPATLHNVRSQEFRVTRRQGRWVYLDRGRAFGLEIGTHLKGPGTAKLHVIQFAPNDTEADVAIALVRSEDLANPLKPGDAIAFDPTQFPVQSSPRLETQPL